MRYVFLHQPGDRLTADQLLIALAESLRDLEGDGVFLDYVPEIKGDTYMPVGKTWLVKLPTLEFHESRRYLVYGDERLVSSYESGRSSWMTGNGPLWYLGGDPELTRWQRVRARIAAWWRWLSAAWRGQ